LTWETRFVQHIPMSRSLLLAAILSIMLGIQTRPTFEVASIKPNNSGDGRSNIGIRQGGRLIATNATLKNLIMMAYLVQDFQVSGGPGWIEADHYDVNAVANENVAPEQVYLMTQALLEERFKLKVHRGTKETDAYVLRLGKNGTKLQEVRGEDSNANHGVQMALRQVYSNKTATITSFAQTLQNVLGKTVIDKTELKGFFQFDLRWGRTSEGEAGPSIFTAIQEQLGLRLEAEKTTIETLIIDSAEKPAINN